MNNSNSLMNSAEKYVELSIKSIDAENKLNVSNKDDHDKLLEEYVSCVHKESEQAKIISKSASLFFKDDYDNWLSFVGCVWAWAQMEITKEEAVILLNKAIDNHVKLLNNLSL